MIRPWPSNLAKIPSTVTVGTIVDVRLHDGWWEGIVVEPRTAGRVRVYFPGDYHFLSAVRSDCLCSSFVFSLLAQWNVDLSHVFQILQEREKLGSLLRVTYDAHSNGLVIDG